MDAKIKTKAPDYGALLWSLISGAKNLDILAFHCNFIASFYTESCVLTLEDRVEKSEHTCIRGVIRHHILYRISDLCL